MAVKVFISYSSKDGRRVKPIKDVLEKYPGLKIFFADDSFFPGDNIPERIKAEIEKCDYLFLFHSKNSLKSQWVQNEIGIAYGKSKTVVPILLDKAKPEGVIKTVTNYLDLTDKKKFDIAVNELLEVVRKKENEKNLSTGLLIISVIIIIGLIIWGNSK
ncbi:toll/interleukin-1 receptor domain-containing protein [bacterium]|nr:toll/interleukin-1 receptor domain-containing protein [bacterium]